MRFFSKFPKILYKLTEIGNLSPRLVEREVSNMTVSLKLTEILNNQESIPVKRYRIKEEDRPEMLAANLYGSSEYVWVLFLANNIRNLYDWPMTEREFNDYMNKKYESPSGELNGIQRSKNLVSPLPGTQYYQTIGETRYFITKETYDYLKTPSTTNELGQISVYDQEYERNEKKRNIIVPDAEILQDIVRQLNVVLR